MYPTFFFLKYIYIGYICFWVFKCRQPYTLHKNFYFPIYSTTNTMNAYKLVVFLLRMDIKDAEKQVATHVALENGHTEIAELLLKQGVKTDIFVSTGFGDIDSVRALLKDDPTLVDSRTRSFCTPLHIAAANGHLRVVEILLKAGADFNSRAYGDRELEAPTPFDKAIAKGHRAVAEFLRVYAAKDPKRNEPTH